MFTPLSEFAYKEGCGLKSVYEGVGVHGEMDGEMIFESIVGIDLLLDMEERV